ncbi:hypothetical protein E4U16_003229 [Claviceps sp. LM84 group G4]|nr:hypothetical protein E4U16_003229 [Claviceps sp. LM84 group G4]
MMGVNRERLRAEGWSIIPGCRHGTGAAPNVSIANFADCTNKCPREAVVNDLSPIQTSLLRHEQM